MRPGLGFLILATLKSEGENGKEQYELSFRNGRTLVSPKKQKRKRTRDDSWYYLSTLGEIGFGIAVPMVVGVAVGAELDSRYGTYPKGTVGLLGLGAVVSVTYLIRIVQSILNDVRK